MRSPATGAKIHRSPATSAPAAAVPSGETDGRDAHAVVATGNSAIRNCWFAAAADGRTRT